MRQPNTSRADFHNQIRVLILVCVTDCPSLADSILMTVDAVQRIRLAVEEKTLVRINAKITKTNRLSQLYRSSMLPSQTISTFA